MGEKRREREREREREIKNRDDDDDVLVACFSSCAFWLIILYDTTIAFEQCCRRKDNRP